MKTCALTGVCAFLAGGFAAILIFGRHEISSRSPACVSDLLLHETPAIQLQSYTSPDGTHVATVSFKYDNPKFEGRYWTVISIASVEKGGALGYGPQPIRLYGSTSISCEWRDAHHLRISYAGKLDADYSKNLLPECEGIMIEYVDLLKSTSLKQKQPNQALQHNDPSCHESCLRTPRASRGRG